jgi:L-aminopeptidase/D-esterase-like protein
MAIIDLQIVSVGVGVGAIVNDEGGGVGAASENIFAASTLPPRLVLFLFLW